MSHLIKKLFYCGTIILLGINSKIVQAQITIDGTTPTIINGNCQAQCQIKGGIVAGQNLFHSFQDFQINSGASVLFDFPQTQNIFTRITGNNISEIFGRLDVTGNANFFLLNPNGIIFGQNAQLNLNGSFVATTANGIQFGNNNFQAIPEAGDNLSLLSVNPSAFLFNQIQGGSININQALLKVNPQQSLVMLAQEGINIDGGILQASMGNIQLGTFLETGTVGIDDNFNLTFPELSNKGDILLTNGTVFDVSGIGAGRIEIAGKDVNISNNSTLISNTLGDLDGQDINFSVDNLTIENNSFISSYSFGSGKAADLDIKATDTVKVIGTQPLEITTLLASAVLSGQEFDIENFRNGLFTYSLNQGDSGNISINSKNLIIDNGAGILNFNFAQSKAGNFNFNTDTFTLSKGSLIGTIAISSEQGGDLNINTNDLKAIELSVIGAISISEDKGGQGGNVLVNAKNSIFLSDGLLDGTLFSGIYNDSFNLGDAGNLTINTNNLLLQKGAQISTSSQGQGAAGQLKVNASFLHIIGDAINENNPNIPTNSGLERNSGFFSGAFNAGNAGNIVVNTDNLLVENGGRLSTSTLGIGKGGNLSVNATNTVEISGNAANGKLSGFFADTLGIQQAGDIEVNTNQLIMNDGGRISTNTFSLGNGGQMNINAKELVELSGISILGESNSGLLASTVNVGNAGEINIDTKRLIVRDGAGISTLTGRKLGQGGNININASESVELLRTPLPGNFLTGVFTNTFGPADAGNLVINTKRLKLEDGAIASTGTLGSGKGGDLIINASESITLSGFLSNGLLVSNIFGNTLGSGDGGDVKITTEKINISNQGLISASTNRTSSEPFFITIPNIGSFPVPVAGTGNAGNLEIEAKSINLDNGGIATITTAGKGGNLHLSVEQLTKLINNSNISATAGGTGNGGNIDFNSEFLLTKNNSSITADAQQGQGGNINITTQGLFLSPDTQITASSELGIDGLVTLNILEIDSNRGIVKLPVNTIDVSTLVRQNCSAKNLQDNQFIISGQGGIPVSPSDLVGNNQILIDLGTDDSFEVKDTSSYLLEQKSNSIVEAQGWIIDDRGKVSLTSQLPSKNSNYLFQKKSCYGN